MILQHVYNRMSLTRRPRLHRDNALQLHAARVLYAISEHHTYRQTSRLHQPGIFGSRASDGGRHAVAIAHATAATARKTNKCHAHHPCYKLGHPARGERFALGARRLHPKNAQHIGRRTNVRAAVARRSLPFALLAVSCIQAESCKVDHKSCGCSSRYDQVSRTSRSR